MIDEPSEVADIPRKRESHWNQRDAFALLLLAVLFLTLFEPFLFRGHVAAPVDQRRVLGLAPAEASPYRSNPRFSDYYRFFIPKMHQHFHGDHAGWNATWNSNFQLGKPVSHFGGYSKAHPITYTLSFLTTDPYRLHTLLGTVTVGLLTLFSYLLMRSLGPAPPAAFLVAVGIGLSTRSAYWFTFVQILASTCWSVGAMWLSVRFTNRRSVATWLALVFVTYCAVIGARHQPTIRAMYLMVPFVLVYVATHASSGRDRLRTLIGLASAVGLALVLSYPLVHDMAMAIGDSTRGTSDIETFLIEHGRGFWDRHLPALWNLFAGGNLHDAAYPDRNTAAMTFTPFLFAMLGAVAFYFDRRASVFAVVFAFFAVMSLSGTVHEFAIRYLGFGFARSNPLGGILIPGMILCGFALDRILKNPGDPSRRAAAIGGAVCMTALGAGSVLLSFKSGQIHWFQFAGGLGLGAAAIAFIVIRSPWILYGVGIVVVGFYSVPSLIHRPLSDVALSSPIVESLRAATDGGWRYAKMKELAPLIPSNIEGVVGLRSIHSYDSLSARRYSEFTASVSGSGATTFGRNFHGLEDPEKLGSPMFHLSGVNAILCKQPLSLENWEIERIGRNRYLAIARNKPPLTLHFDGFPEGAPVNVDWAMIRAAEERPIEIVERRDDAMAFSVVPSSANTILFVSAQYHRDWKAESREHPLRVVPINGVYLGVVLPPDTDAVRLAFEPLARYAWFPLVFFAVAFGVLALWTGWSIGNQKAGRRLDRDQ